MGADREFRDFVERLQEWHDHRSEQLNRILAHKDADIVLDERTIKADSDTARGIRIGVSLSLHLLGKLPFSVTTNEEQEDV